jgi:hypothetical protein
MMSDHGLQGAEREWGQETARLSQRGYDPHRLWVPFAALHQSRDLQAASAGAGGFLVDAVTLPARDILRPWSVTLRGGITVVESLTSDAVLPVVTGNDVSVTWSQDETTEAQPSTPTLASAALSPKTAIGLLQASRNFMKQADPERWIRRELLRTAGSVVDTAVLNGSGASSQPLGILQSPDLSTQSGTGLAWAGVLAMKGNAVEVNAQDGTISFIGTTSVRELLEGRERATGGGTFLWEDDRIASCAAFATTLMPAATLLSGPMAEVHFGLWGAGMSVQVNPFDPTLFKTGAVQIRVVVSCDVAIGCDRTAFTKAESIS